MFVFDSFLILHQENDGLNKVCFKKSPHLQGLVFKPKQSIQTLSYWSDQFEYSLISFGKLFPEVKGKVGGESQ